jgi:hypothetical protein
MTFNSNDYLFMNKILDDLTNGASRMSESQEIDFAAALGVDLKGKVKPVTKLTEKSSKNKIDFDLQDKRTLSDMAEQKRTSQIYMIATPNVTHVFVGATNSRNLARVLETKLSAWERYKDTEKGKYSECFAIFEAGGEYISLVEECEWETVAQRDLSIFYAQDALCAINKPQDPNAEKILSDRAYGTMCESEDEDEAEPIEDIHKVGGGCPIPIAPKALPKPMKKSRMKMTCECGKTFQRSNKARHEDTKFHNKYIDEVN